MISKGVALFVLLYIKSMQICQLCECLSNFLLFTTQCVKWEMNV